jgi:RecA/RadA recombinase
MALNRFARSSPAARAPATGGPGVQITHNGAMLGYEAPDGKAIYICKEPGPESIWKLPADGRYLTYAQLDNPGSNLMLTENFH